MVKLHLVTFFDSRESFFHYIDICNQSYREETDSRNSYLGMMSRYRTAKDYKQLFSDDSYVKQAYGTLEQWNMNQRGARMVPLPEFTESVSKNIEHLEALSKYRLESLKWGELIRNVFPLLKTLFTNLRVMESSARIVGVSKALHFLLPDLVMPIDRTYTLNFFYLGGGYSARPEKEFEYFKEVFEEYVKAAHDLHLSATM